MVHMVTAFDCLKALDLVREASVGEHWFFVGMRNKFREVPMNMKRSIYSVFFDTYVDADRRIVSSCGYRDMYGTENCMNPEHMTSEPVR